MPGGTTRFSGAAQQNALPGRCERSAAVLFVTALDRFPFALHHYLGVSKIQP
jgi:hypothetical protein